MTMDDCTITFAQPVGTEPPPKTKKAKAKAKGKKDERITDYFLAKQVCEDWGKPLVFHAGSMWSFAPESGWTVVTNQVMGLANQLKQGNSEKSVWPILVAALSTPNAEDVSEPATYWERRGGLWEDRFEWIPFRLSPSQILFANGVLDVADMSFEVIEQRVVFGPRVSVPFDLADGLDLRCDEFELMVERALPDPIERDYLQKICGLILQPHVLFRGQIVFWGAPHSGKTTLARAIAMAPAGAVGGSFITENQLVRNKWSLVNLANKFCNVADDSEFDNRWENFMKNYTSGMVQIEPKFCKVSTVPATAKIISTCNEFQRLVDESGAAEQRYRVFQMDNVIGQTGQSSQTEYLHPRYWCDIERRSGIVAWMLRGIIAGLADGLEEPEIIKQKKLQAVGSGNPVYLWVLENIKPNPKQFIKSKDLLEICMKDDVDASGKSLASVMRKIGCSPAKHKGERGFWAEVINE